MTRSIVTILALSFAGCTAMLPPYETVSREVHELHLARRREAIERTMQARQLTAANVPTAGVMLPDDVERCGEGEPPQVTIRWTVDGGTAREAIVDACALREILGGAPRVLAATASDGAALAFVRASDLDMHATASTDLEDYVLAKAPDGGYVVLQPRRNVTETRRARVRGTCNRMPSPGGWSGATARVFVLEGAAPEKIEAVQVPYDAVRIEQACDRVVE